MLRLVAFTGKGPILQGWLTSIFSTPTTPSAVLVIGEFGRSIYAFHILPEDGSMEWFGTTHPSLTFNRGGATEQRRENIGEVTVPIENFEAFLRGIETRIPELWDDSMRLSPAQLQTGGIDVVSPLVEKVLRPAALDAIRGRNGQEPSRNGTRFPICIVYVKRSRPRLMPDNFTSFPWSQ